MLAYLNNIFVAFVGFAKMNPVISGIAGVWGLGVLTFLFKEVPKQAMLFFAKQFTVSLDINCHDEAFHNFIIWYEGNGHSKKSRTLRISEKKQSGIDSVNILSAGYGSHFFFFKGYPFKLTRLKEETGNFYSVRGKIHLVTVGRSQVPIRELLKAIDPLSDSSKKTKVYKWDEGYWNFAFDQDVRSLDTIILKEKYKEQLISHLQNFNTNKDWYNKHCIPYRTGICLYGPPGTGKTSLVRAICGINGYDLYVLNLNAMTDRGLVAAFDKIDKNAVILIEDIDSFSSTNKRVSNKDKKENDGQSLTLSGVLNAVDGITASNGRILIITTNHLETLDSALVRPGRIDLLINLNFMDESMAKEALKRFFPNYKIPYFNLKANLTPAEFQNSIMSFKENPEKVIEAISERYYFEDGSKFMGTGMVK